jgi:CRISPR-associated protein Csc1
MDRGMHKMPTVSNIHLWRCDLTLHDYLFFATTKRGSITEMGQFIHNYSLTYALGWAKSEWHVERQEPQYIQQLSKVKGIYVTPANFLTGDYTLVPYRTETEGYTLSAIPDLNGISYGITKCFRPGSVFRFYLLARFHLDRIPPLVRLGRFMAKAEIVKQYPMELEIAEGNCAVSSLLNWDDMAVKPSLCDVIVYALPGRLIENARFVGTRYLNAKFADGEEVKLPLEMGYFQKELCSSW